MAWSNGIRRAARRAPFAPIALFGATLVVYVSTLSPGVLGGDVGELQFVPYILSRAHFTGTPLYILLGWLWLRLPLGRSVAWQMNLLSAISASAAVVILFALVRRRASDLAPALVAALSLAFAPVYWEQATMADKYAFSALLAAATLYLALRWGETRSSRTLDLLAFTYGLSLTHHRTAILFAPFLLAYVACREGRGLWRDWRRLLRLMALMALPLLFYLYIPWAEARRLPPRTPYPSTLVGWFREFTETGQGGYVYVDAADVRERLLFFAQTLRRDFTWVGVLLGLAGLARQARRRPVDALLLAGSFTLHGFLAANYHLPRQWTYFLPSFMVYAIWIGEGLDMAATALGRLIAARTRRKIPTEALLAVPMLALVLIPLPARYAPFREAHLGAGVLDVWRQELKQGLMAERLGRAMADVAPRAVIVGDWEQATPLWYMQRVEGLRPDVRIIYPVERLEVAAGTGRPLYLARNYPDLDARWHPTAAGPLIALQTAPARQPPSDICPAHIRMGDTFELVGSACPRAVFHPVDVVPLTLYWRALEAPPHDYAVSLRLLGHHGEAIHQLDSQHPVLGTYPTSRWTMDEVVGDYYEIQLPAHLSPGRYRWGAVLYRILPDGGWENLKVAGTEEEMACGGTIEVRARHRAGLATFRMPGLLRR